MPRPGPLVWRAPEGLEGQAAEPAGGGGAWWCFEPTHKRTSATRPNWCGGRRRGLAAVLVGGGGAWPDNESTRRVKLAARTTRGRAAAHGHTKQPGPAGSPAQRAARPHTPTGGAKCES